MTMQITAPQAQNLCCFKQITSGTVCALLFFTGYHKRWSGAHGFSPQSSRSDILLRARRR